MIPMVILLSSQTLRSLFQFSRGTEQQSLACWRSTGKRWFLFGACGPTRAPIAVRLFSPMQTRMAVCERASLISPILLRRAARCLSGRVLMQPPPVWPDLRLTRKRGRQASRAFLREHLPVRHFAEALSFRDDFAAFLRVSAPQRLQHRNGDSKLILLKMECKCGDGIGEDAGLLDAPTD
jgi:hypothetical protein